MVNTKEEEILDAAKNLLDASHRLMRVPQGPQLLDANIKYQEAWDKMKAVAKGAN